MIVNSQEIEIFTEKQLRNINEYVQEIIQTLPDKALDELVSGYEGDLDYLLDELARQTNYVINHNASKIESESIGHLKHIEYSIDQQLKKYSLNYFASTVPSNFDSSWRTLEWGNMLQLYPWSAYLCQRGSGKSMRINELVVMADGTLKEIQYIKVGDQVMGVDGTPRNVLSTHRGIDDMYEIQQANTENYVTNSRHTLHYKRGSYISWRDKNGIHRKKMIFDKDHTQIVEIETKDFHQKSRLYKSQSFGYRVKGWNLPEKELRLEPYYLGLWLGDGTSINQHITNIDLEVIDYLKGYSERLNLNLSHYGVTHCITNIQGKSNILRQQLKLYNLLNNKHIPEDYLLSSRQQRLELLSGLIDSDGTTSTRNSSYSITQKNENLLKQIQRLCWSLGFRANIKPRNVKLTYGDKRIYKSYTLHISGDVWDIPCKIARKKITKYNRIQDSQRSKLSTKLLGKGEYCGFECDGDKLFLLKDGTVVHNSYFFNYVVPMWRLYTYDPPLFMVKDTRDNRNRKETVIITNEKRLGILHINKITDEIRSNEILSSKLNRKGKEMGKEGLITDTGSQLHLRSYGSFIRGLHVGYVGVDDFLDKSTLYSRDQRDKYKEVFYAEIKNIVEPGGNLIVSGTPFHQKDLYNDLKEDPMFKVFEYPGIFPNGQLLAPDRFSFRYLMDMKKSLGSIVFSREIQVTPVSDGSSLFPWEFLEKAFIGMENVGLVENIESYPFKLRKVVIGCDFARSGKIGADFTFYTVWGIDMSERYHLLHIWRKQGASHDEQINKMVQLDHQFHPNQIVCEVNGFQGILADLARQRGLKNIVDFTTLGKNKKSDYEGLPSLSALFERGEILMPYRDGETREAVMQLCSEFNSITYDSDKGSLSSSSEHDDGPMSVWVALNTLRENKVNANIYYM